MLPRIDGVHLEKEALSSHLKALSTRLHGPNCRLPTAVHQGAWALAHFSMEWWDDVGVWPPGLLNPPLNPTYLLTNSIWHCRVCLNLCYTISSDYEETQFNTTHVNLDSKVHTKTFPGDICKESLSLTKPRETTIFFPLGMNREESSLDCNANLASWEMKTVQDQSHHEAHATSVFPVTKASAFPCCSVCLSLLWPAAQHSALV